MLQNTFILPQRFLVLLDRSQEHSFCFCTVGFKEANKDDFIWKFHLSQSYLAILAPEALEGLAVRINALAVAFLEALPQFSLIDLA